MVWVGCSFLWCTIIFVFLLSPSPMVVPKWTEGSLRHVRKPVTSETADVPPSLLLQINFSRARCLAEGCQHPGTTPGTTPGAATACRRSRPDIYL